MTSSEVKYIQVPKDDYEELCKRLHEAEKIMLKQKDEESEIIESIKRLNPKKVTMEF